jgi:hypothetical protein
VGNFHKLPTTGRGRSAHRAKPHEQLNIGLKLAPFFATFIRFTQASRKDTKLLEHAWFKEVAVAARDSGNLSLY